MLRGQEKTRFWHPFKILLYRRELLTAALILTFSLSFGALLPAAGHANQIMPDFANISTDNWYIDRYAPNSFTNLRTFEGRDNVLGIGISSAQGFNSRPSGYQDSFYNTQGRDHAISGGVGSILSADLYIPATWADASQGVFRTDMWGVLPDSTIQGADKNHYPIIGFTNYGKLGARYRVFDGSTGWVDLGTSVKYDRWTSLSIDFTASAFVYSINGQEVYSDSNVGDTKGFLAVDMQAYNFYDTTNFPNVNAQDYTAYWSNTPAPAPAPIPASVVLLGTGLVGLGIGSRRKIFRK